MCGLVGAFRSEKGFFTKAPQYITQGLFISVLRGYSGCGVALIDKDFKPDMVKSRLASPDFIQTKSYTWVENKAPGARAIMGHTRAPTGGGASYENSHPFWYHRDGNISDSVILTHNGHVNNYHALTPNEFRHDVDSAHVTHSILINGALDTLKKLQGYYVLTWYSEKDKTFHIARNNSNRDLFLAKNIAGDVMYYASEKEILQFLLDRLDINYAGKGTDSAFWQLDPLKLYSWDLSKDTLLSPVVEEYEEKKSCTTTYHTGTNSSSKSFGLPDAGDRIWVDVVSNAVSLYSNSTTHGHLDAIRRIDNGDVRIDGVCKEDWDKRFPSTKNSIACIVDHASSEMIGGVVKYKYKVRLHPKSIEEDSRRFLPPPETKKGEQEKKEQVAVVLFDPTTGVSQEMWPGPNDTMISLQEWREIAKQGCAGCRGVILTLDKDKILWYPWARCPEDPPDETEWQMICPMCAGDEKKLADIFGA